MRWKRFTRQREERFTRAYEAAQRHIEHLEYADAIQQLRIAQREGIDTHKLRTLAWELPYALLELGQLDDFYASLKYLTEVGETETGVKDIQDSESQDISRLKERLKILKPEWYERMEKQYYPEMVAIPGGSFMMGCDGEEKLFDFEGPAHRVYLSNYSIGTTSVTFYQYGLYCLLEGRRMPSDSGFGRGNSPVINVSWSDALKYCNWLSERTGMEQVYEDITDRDATPFWERKGFRLPTEAEWEFAAREGGKDRRFGNGKDHADPMEINFDGEYSENKHERVKHYITMGERRGRTTPVKTFAPNALGLYDMSGNVYDWCWDWYDAQYYENFEDEHAKEAHDPKGPDSSPEGRRVIRGGSWFNPAYTCRCAYRDYDNPRSLSPSNGFRVAGYFTL